MFGFFRSSSVLRGDIAIEGVSRVLGTTSARRFDNEAQSSTQVIPAIASSSEMRCARRGSGQQHVRNIGPSPTTPAANQRVE
jgi:hypothetical protein